VLILGTQKKINPAVGTKLYKHAGMATFNFTVLITHIATGGPYKWLIHSSAYALKATALFVSTKNSAVTITYKSIRGE
jgi:hypothetical protein